jgi:hypothetical protein
MTALSSVGSAAERNNVMLRKEAGCPDIETLAKLVLNPVQKGFLQHIQGCRRCATYGLVLTSIKKDMNVETAEGGIFILDVDPNDRDNLYLGIAVGMFTSSVFGISNEDPFPVARIVPVNFDLRESYIGWNKTILAKSSDSPMNLPFVVEWWNDRYVLQSQLKFYLGHISQDLDRKIADAKPEETPIVFEKDKPAPSIDLYRSIKKMEGFVYSQHLRKYIETLPGAEHDYN